MPKNLNYQAAAVRHFLPTVEKEDAAGSIAAQYREALQTLEWLASYQAYIRTGHELKSERPDLAYYCEAMHER